MNINENVDVIKDVEEFLKKFEFEILSRPGFHPAMKDRINHIDEEFAELKKAVNENNLEETVDALLDIVYICIGTSIMCGFDTEKHWTEIQEANMAKIRGITRRGHNYDVCKPKGWTPPNHEKIIKEKK